MNKSGLAAGGAPAAATVAAALENGVSFYEGLQADDGHWPGDYGGPMFLMPGMIITLYTTGVLDSVLRWAGVAQRCGYGGCFGGGWGGSKGGGRAQICNLHSSRYISTVS